MMNRVIFVLLPMLISMGCGTNFTATEPSVAPLPMVILDGDEFVECDLCRRGQSGENLWCDETNQGYVGGETVTSYACFECKSAGSQYCESCLEPTPQNRAASCDDRDANVKTEASDCGGDA